MAFGLAGAGAATGATGRSFVFAAGAANFAGLADRFFFLAAAALRAAVFFATGRLFLLAAAFFFFLFTAALVFLTDTFFLAAPLRTRFVLRAPTFFLAALPCFDFNFFAMDNSAVGRCGFRQEWPRRTRPGGFSLRELSAARGIGKAAERPEYQGLPVEIVDIGVTGRGAQFAPDVGNVGRPHLVGEAVR